MSGSKALFLVAAIAGLLGVGTAVRQATVGAAGCSACALHSSQQDPLHVSHDGTLCTAVEHCVSGEKSSQACCAADASVTTFVYEGARSACAACAEEHAIGPAEQGGPGPVIDTSEMPHAGNNSAVTQATDDSFADIVDENSGTVLVDFYADWCGPCQVQRGVLEEYAAEHSNVHVVRVNVDESPTLAQMYLIDSIPDLKVFRDGRLVIEHVGLADGDTIDALLLEAE